MIKNCLNKVEQYVNMSDDTVLNVPTFKHLKAITTHSNVIYETIMSRAACSCTNLYIQQVIMKSKKNISHSSYIKSYFTFWQ